MLPKAVSINSALALLSPDAASKPWANGPAICVIRTSYRVGDGMRGTLLSLSSADSLTTAIRELTGQVGALLAMEYLPNGYSGLHHPYTPGSGTIVTAVYPRPIELKDREGNEVASAKWVGIQFGRSDDKPNQILYGSVTYIVEGAFELGDVSQLERAIPSSYYEQ